MTDIFFGQLMFYAAKMTTRPTKVCGYFTSCIIPL